MILDIVQYGHPVLRERCKPVVRVDETLRQLVADMLETMYDANGVGLAAPQIGQAIRLAVVDVSHDPECISFLKVAGQDAPLASIMPLVFINPELEFTGPKQRDTEGCLSIDDVRAEVSRPVSLKAKLPQLDGSVLEIETDGLLARAIQHETDHLNGVLFIDRVSPAAKIALRRKLRRLVAGD
jgi:peptide deformylase